ncbi:MAG: H-X9-DG-CTERM domain-containing protein, partial [Thermoguttaceae bacterium]
PAGDVNRCSQETDGDCNFLMASSGYREFSVARHLGGGGETLVGNAAAHAGKRPVFTYNFGGCHPGTVNFLIGDGSVRSISTTTPASTWLRDGQKDILACLAIVNDGTSVSLP